MIRIVDKEDRQPVIKKTMYHNSDIFIRARDFYHIHEEYRNEQIAIVDENEDIQYMLQWEPNIITYPRLSKEVILNLYVSDFWEYGIDSPRMDFDYIRDIDTFIFCEVEEYSVEATKVIHKYFPEKKIYFTDERAKWFFGDEVIINNISKDVEEEALKVGSDMIYSIHFGHYVLEKQHANSINLMSSLYWLSETVEYGDKNPDKVFYVIKSPIASSGLVKFISFLLYFVSVAYDKKDKKVIPVLDTAIAGDENQFNNGVYNDVWGMFFQQVSDYSLEEVYNSKNVIIGQEGKMGANPYLMYVEYHSNIGPLMKKYLKLNNSIESYCSKVREELAIPKGSKVLGVVGRGTDFYNPGVAALHTLPLDANGIVKKAREVYEKGEYDYIFLATEDQNVFDTFMASDLSKVTKHIKQNRYSIDAKKELLHNKYLEENKSGNRNGYEEAKGYLAILEMLRRCNGIVASTDCGAVDYAMSMTDNELEDLYIHGHDTNEFLINK